MYGDQIEETLALVREETKEWGEAMSLGRALVDAAAQETNPARAAQKLRQAMRQFQAAIARNSMKDEGYGWLGRTLRLLAQSIRDHKPEAATHCLLYACAVVWEGRSKTPSAALSVFTKQEAKSLVAWVRMSKRLDPVAGEREMETLRSTYLTMALDPDTMAAVTGI